MTVGEGGPSGPPTTPGAPTPNVPQAILDTLAMLASTEGDGPWVPRYRLEQEIFDLASDAELEHALRVLIGSQRLVAQAIRRWEPTGRLMLCCRLRGAIQQSLF